MIWDWFAVYSGTQVSYAFMNYEFNIVGEESKIKKMEDHFWSYGPFVGIQLNTTGSHWKIIFALEVGITSIPVATGWYKGKKRIWRPGKAGSLSILFQF